MPELKESLEPGSLESSVSVPRNRKHSESPAEDYPVADFYDSITFTWDEDTYLVRQALKEFSEATDADH